MTNTWIQRILALGVPIALWIWACMLWPAHPWIALACGVAPLLIMPVLEALQFSLMLNINRSDAAPRASLVQHLLAWWSEVGITAKVFLWWQPFRRMAIPNNLTNSSGKRGVVLVHGFFCNRGLWTRWMRRMQAEGRVFVAVDLEPAFSSIDEYVDIIERAVREVRGATGLAPLLVGHSMGGLAIRAWLAQLAAKKTTSAQQEPVHRVITVGTPHHGTWMGRLPLTTNGSQMRLGSVWLKDLERQEIALNFSSFVCFFSNCDNIVFPVSNAILEGADNRLVQSVGHVALIEHPDVIQACWHLMQ